MDCPDDAVGECFAALQEIEIDTALPSYELPSAVGVRQRKQRDLQRHERARRGEDRIPLSSETLAALHRAGVRVRIRLRSGRKLCGARTRKGHACRCLALKNGRCRLHGGLSTGPRTSEGWARTRAGYAAWADRNRQLALDGSETSEALLDEKP